MRSCRQHTRLAQRARCKGERNGGPPRRGVRGCLFAAGLILAFTAMRAAPARAAGSPGIWSVNLENSAVSLGPVSDRNYTNGIGLGWTSAPGVLPHIVGPLSRALFGPGEERISLGIFQQIFTPDDTRADPPSPFQRPYAGYLALHLALLQEHANTQNMLAVDLGLIGPAALGEEVQNGFHRIIGQDATRGWGSQLHNEPTLEIYTSRTWRLPLGKLGGLDTDALPAVALGIGNVRIYGEGGAVFRIGRGLAADFGPNRLFPATGGSPVFVTVRPFAWYFFVGAGGEAVAHDLFLAGNTFSAGPHVTANPFLGTFEAGFAVIIHGIRISYMQVFQTKAWHGQQGGMFNYGALEIAARF